MNRDKILSAAKALEPKVRLEEHKEAVQLMREKGYSWREIADFLNKQGVQTDHTRVYRTFGQLPKPVSPDARSVEISKVTFVGERRSKKNNSWHILDIVLPSKLGSEISLVGHTWGKGAPSYAMTSEGIPVKNASLLIKSGTKFPFAYINLDINMTDGNWVNQDVYIMPKWEEIL